MSEVADFEFPQGFKIPYKDSDERNDNLQVMGEMLKEDIILDGVKDLLKKKNYYVQAMVEEEELTIAPEQESVDTFVKEFTLEYMKSDVQTLIKRLRFKANAMSKKEFEEKMNMLKATLITIDSEDLKGISFDKLREFEDKLGLLPVDEDTKRHCMESTYAERVKAFEDDKDLNADGESPERGVKNKKAEDLVNKWTEEREQRLQKKREERKKKKMDAKRRQEQQKMEDEKTQIQKAEMRKKMEQEIREKMKEHERQRAELLEKWKRDDQELAKKKYKHIEMEERYTKKVVIPSLERKKEELRKKREMLAPLRHEDFVTHEKAYTERLKMKLKEKRQKREKWYKEIGYGDYDPSIYQSKYLSSAEKEQKQRMEPLIDPNTILIEKYDKQRNYAKFVKEMHKPKISVKKKHEMKTIIEAVENSGMSRSLEMSRHKSQEVIKRLEQKNQRPNYENYLRSKPYVSQSVMRSSKKLPWQIENPMVPKPKLQRKGYMVDYLLKKRIRRQEMEQDDPDYATKGKTNWDRVGISKSMMHTRKPSNAYEEDTIIPQSRFDAEMKKTEDQVIKERLEIIKTRAKQIEAEAKEKEKNMKLTSGTNVKVSNEINSLLIDSIEAKLHLLKDI